MRAWILTLVLAAAAVGCQRKPSPPRTPPPAPSRAQPKPAQLDLPQLERPTLAPAERVVDILYSSNVAGEAEPCG